MKRPLITMALAAAALALFLVGVATASASLPVSGPTVVASFDAGTFAEGLAADGSGGLLTSLTRWGETSDSGEVWEAGAHGGMTLLAAIDVGPGILTGIASDGTGGVYAAAATFSAAPLPGVFHVDASGAVTRVMTLPATSFPNGIAIHAGSIWVSDSSRGAIWRAPLDSASSPSTPWLRNALLKPSVNGIGVNGIAFRQSRLYMAVSDSGRIFRVRIKADGSAGDLTTVINAKALRTADGIAFDARGGLWIVTNHAAGAAAGASGGLYRLSPTGVLETIAANPGWLDYPTEPVFGTTIATGTTLYIANGSFEMGMPTIISVDAGVAGLPLD